MKKVMKNVVNIQKLTAVMLIIALMFVPLGRMEAKTNNSRYTTVSEAASLVRAQMVNHAPKVVAYVKSTDRNAVNVFDELEEEIFKETSKGDEGDYIRWDVNREYPSYNCKPVKQGNTTYYYYKFTMEYLYFTTLEQKQQVDQKVKEIISGFHFTSATTDYEKIAMIYDYVCENVQYAEDVNEDISYTSWSALFQHKAVCQGYAQLLYRMFKEVGISCRVVPGYGRNTDVLHGWNIVKLGNYYYNIDATWDSERRQDGKEYAYFLKGDHFKYHSRLAEYTTSEFYAAYPMYDGDYSEGNSGLSSASRKSAFRVIRPKFKSLSRKKVKLVKVADAAKYQIKYSVNRKFKTGNKTVTTKKTVYKFKKLTKKKTYYVKFRAYTFIDGTKVYTRWSKVKKIKKKK